MLILLRPNMLINKLIKPKCLFRFAFMCISLQILHLCSFSMAAIINNNKLGHLHHHKCTLLHFWRSEIRNEFVLLGKNQGISKTLLSLEGIRKNLISCLFRLLDLHSLYFLAHGHLLHLQGQQCSIFISFSAEFLYHLTNYNKIPLYFPLISMLVDYIQGLPRFPE